MMNSDFARFGRGLLPDNIAVAPAFWAFAPDARREEGVLRGASCSVAIILTRWFARGPHKRPVAWPKTHESTQPRKWETWSRQGAVNAGSRL